jgi:hypothetical protein
VSVGDRCSNISLLLSYRRYCVSRAARRAPSSNVPVPLNYCPVHYMPVQAVQGLRTTYYPPRSPYLRHLPFIYDSERSFAYSSRCTEGKLWCPQPWDAALTLSVCDPIAIHRQFVVIDPPMYDVARRRLFTLRRRVEDPDLLLLRTVIPSPVILHR